MPNNYTVDVTVAVTCHVHSYGRYAERVSGQEKANVRGVENNTRQRWPNLFVSLDL